MAWVLPGLPFLRMSYNRKKFDKAKKAKQIFKKKPHKKPKYNETLPQESETKRYN